MLPSHPLYYFSTHNALRGADGEDLHFRVCFEELHGSRSCELDIYPFYDVQMVKRLLIKKLRLPASMQVRICFLFRKKTVQQPFSLARVSLDALYLLRLLHPAIDDWPSCLCGCLSTRCCSSMGCFNVHGGLLGPGRSATEAAFFVAYLFVAG